MKLRKFAVGEPNVTRLKRYCMDECASLTYTMVLRYTFFHMIRQMPKELQILTQHLPPLEERYHIKHIGIFGSVAKGRSTRGSDVDVLVEFSKPIGFFKFLELEEDLGKILGRKVDLVSRDALKPIVRQAILSETVYA